MTEDRLHRLTAKRRVVVCAGAGGVGKTTIAAALSLAAARRGRRVLCLTIDPARRLADSLGLSLSPGVEVEVKAE
ncbi:MAG TPA: ArsA-related P-loop ATPase, partial [Polyangiaceae bacterium]|nr:ArsA-related P-loop ATPase [Polyangiaceae bacterium]